MSGTPSKYETASLGSRRIIDLLFEHLRQHAPELTRKDVPSMTTLGAPGHVEFVFAYLKKKKEDVTVYFIGDAEAPYQLLPGMPTLRTRAKFANPRTKLTPYFTTIETVAQVGPFAEFLYAYSMPLAVLGRSRKSNQIQEFQSPDEVSNAEHWEGHSTTVLVNRYERNRGARQTYLELHGKTCSGCGMSFAKIYGDQYSECIQVHHITPISQMAGRYKVNPKKDLTPLCPNCHSVVHKSDPPMDIKHLIELIQSRDRSK